MRAPRACCRCFQLAMSLLLDDAPIVWLYQYQAVWGVTSRFDYQVAGTGEMHAWNLKPKGTA